MRSVDDLVGVPFVNRGRDVSKGLDCWGLLREAMARFGKHIPDVSVSAYATREIARMYQQVCRGFVQVQEPEPGDVVAMAIDPEAFDVIQHAGVFVGGGKMLHTIEKTGSIMVRVDHPYWKNRVKGFYRWTE